MKPFFYYSLLTICFCSFSICRATGILGVVKTQDGTPLLGATVELVYKEQTIASSPTYNQGYYFISASLDSLSNNYKITVKKHGYQTYTLNNIITNTDRLQQDFTLKKLDINISADSSGTYMPVQNPLEIKLLYIVPDSSLYE